MEYFSLVALVSRGFIEDSDVEEIVRGILEYSTLGDVLDEAVASLTQCVFCDAAELTFTCVEEEIELFSDVLHKAAVLF